MIHRDLTKKLQSIAQKFPVVALLGPRQSGKTTLVRVSDLWRRDRAASRTDLAFELSIGLLDCYKGITPEKIF